MSATHYSVPEMIVKLREFCGCYSCLGGPRELGGHTIARPDHPRPTPASCALPTLLKHYLENPDEAVRPDRTAGDLEAEVRKRLRNGCGCNNGGATPGEHLDHCVMLSGILDAAK